MTPGQGWSYNFYLINKACWALSLLVMVSDLTYPKMKTIVSLGVSNHQLSGAKLQQDRNPLPPTRPIVQTFLKGIYLLQAGVTLVQGNYLSLFATVI